VLLSLLYQLMRALLGALTVICRREVSKDAELLVLRHENMVLRRQITRVRYTAAGRSGWLPWPVGSPAAAGGRSSRSLLRPCLRGTVAWWPARGMTATGAGQSSAHPGADQDTPRAHGLGQPRLGASAHPG
jgi:hypothetical protein